MRSLARISHHHPWIKSGAGFSPCGPPRWRLRTLAAAGAEKCGLAYLAGLIFIGLILVIHGCGSTAEAPVLSPGEDRYVARESRAADSHSPDKTYHAVVRGDTLYSIAWRYSLDYRELASWNGISPPYTIYPGQKIHLIKMSVTPDRPANTARKNTPVTSAATATPGNRADTASGSTLSGGPDIIWRWPTQGKLVKLNSPTLQKGVNITGTTGQAILAAAGGDVVYSGSGLLGYGKLIIIKHNEVYLSAYAHNEEILVKEGMRVSSGQKIATMGKDTDQRPLLHFEIRKEGKPVDPLKHLPEQQS